MATIRTNDQKHKLPEPQSSALQQFCNVGCFSHSGFGLVFIPNISVSNTTTLLLPTTTATAAAASGAAAAAAAAAAATASSPTMPHSS